MHEQTENSGTKSAQQVSPNVLSYKEGKLKILPYNEAAAHFSDGLTRIRRLRKIEMTTDAELKLYSDNITELEAELKKAHSTIHNLSKALADKTKPENNGSSTIPTNRYERSDLEYHAGDSAIISKFLSEEWPSAQAEFDSSVAEYPETDRGILLDVASRLIWQIIIEDSQKTNHPLWACQPQQYWVKELRRLVIREQE